METHPENKTQKKKKKRIAIWPFKYLISNLKINPKKKKKRVDTSGSFMGKFFPNFQGKLNYYLLQSVPEKKKKER